MIAWFKLHCAERKRADSLFACLDEATAAHSMDNTRQTPRLHFMLRRLGLILQLIGYFKPEWDLLRIESNRIEQNGANGTNGDAVARE